MVNNKASVHEVSQVPIFSVHGVWFQILRVSIRSKLERTLLANFWNYLQLVQSKVGHFARDHLEHDAAERPHIDLVR